MAFVCEEPAVAPATRSRRHPLHRADVGDAVRGRSGRSAQIIMLLSLFLVDVLSAQVAFFLGAALYSKFGSEGVTAFDFSLQLSLMALTLPIGYILLDIYRVQGQAPIERFPLRIKTTCLLFALLVAWHYATQRILWPAGAAALTFLLMVVLPLIGESIIRIILIRWGLWGVPTVVIGAGPTGQQVVRMLRQMPELGLRPVGVFDDCHAHDDFSPAVVENLPVLGSIADSVKYSRDIETAVVTTPANANATVDAVASQLSYRNIIVVPDLRDLPTLWVRTRDLNGLMGLQMRRNLLLKRNRLLKQAIDHLVALPLSFLSAPIIAILCLWIVAVSKGSPFYTQLRAGKGDRPIKVWKLRTMYPDAEQQLEQYLSSNPGAREEWQRYFKLTNDPRILPGVGHFLRRSSLDELPQLFNVLRGEMSLVGPRPLSKEELDQSFDAGFQSMRASVIPGITGLWQVSARSDGDQQVQQALDTYYIRNWSIWIDFYILFRTFGAVVAGRGAR
jgi:Undecaprenyl-phosphate galactose phosphotransferase WbaP